MNKTPEQMAEEYSQIIKVSQDVDLDDLSWALISKWEAESFLAGYQAAKDHYFQMIQDLQQTVFELKQELKIEL